MSKHGALGEYRTRTLITTHEKRLSKQGLFENKHKNWGTARITALSDLAVVFFLTGLLRNCIIHPVIIYVFKLMRKGKDERLVDIVWCTHDTLRSLVEAIMQHLCPAIHN